LGIGQEANYSLP